MLQAHEGELCGRELDPQCFSDNGPFLSPNSEALEDCALLIDVGYIGQKLTCYKPTTMGLEQLLPNCRLGFACLSERSCLLGVLKLSWRREIRF
nr:hypothetical protein CFP56_42775 [Quercus suber]